jgi:hypothetical protein
MRASGLGGSMRSCLEHDTGLGNSLCSGLGPGTGRGESILPALGRWAKTILTPTDNGEGGLMASLTLGLDELEIQLKTASLDRILDPACQEAPVPIVQNLINLLLLWIRLKF